MSEQPFERLAWQNRFVRELIQPMEGTDCFVPFVSLAPEDNIIVLKLSEVEYVKMFSALLTGADITYPDESTQIVINFLKGLHCPPELQTEECTTYPTYATFISYSPMNPYLQPNLIPDGYLTQPFLVNGENGNDIPGFEHFDVIVPFDAITFDLNFFEDISGQLPTIQILVQGEGHVNIRFLTTPQGGLAVVTVDNPPDLLDILAGIVTSAENIVDLNRDMVSLPPETATEIIFPAATTGAGMHTIYIVFLPILDDSLIPVRFGGGFRGAELCGFIPEGDMGIQNLRFQDCNLEQQNSDGSWTIVDGWEDWLSCIPSDPGGGGLAGLAIKNYGANPPAPSFTTASTTFVAVTGFSRSHAFTKPNAQIFFQNIGMTGTGGNAMECRVKLNGNVGLDGTLARITGNETKEMDVSDRWSDLTPGTYNITLEARVTGGTAGTVQQQSQFNITIIEYDDESDLEFLQDVRYQGGVLQKQLGGVWSDVVDIAGLLAPIQATANNAQATANSAVAVNTTQNSQIAAIVSVNNTQNTRLNNLESDVGDLQLSVAQHNIDIADLQSRMNVQENLMAQVAFGGVWAWLHDFQSGGGGYILGTGTGYTPGVGWVSNVNGLEIIQADDAIRENQITHMQAVVVYTAAPTSDPVWKVNNSEQGLIAYNGLNVESYGWLRMPNRDTNTLTVSFEGVGGSFVLKYLRYLGRGTDVPFD